MFTSPVAARVVAGSGGVIRGKAALREYSAAALALISDLHLQVLDHYVGVSTIVINYRNQQRGGAVCEVLTVDGATVTILVAFRDAGGTVVAGHGTYLAQDGGNPAGLRDAATPS